MASKALTEFQSAIALAEALYSLETNYPDPPTFENKGMLETVRALRGGAVVLMVGAFERYTRESMEEHISQINSVPPRKPFAELPEKMQVAKEWARAEAQQFVHDKLDEIVSSRHKAAHAASVLNVSRADVVGGIRFLKALAIAIDELLASFVASIL
jgi:hypothetical protein